MTEELLSRGNSVVVDNTNMDVQSRAPYLEIAKRRSVPVRAFIMETSFDHAQHNEVVS